jgi:putative ABC transport system permease protein
MYLNENLSIAWTQLKSSKLRAVLTTLGITIGVGTVIFIVAILEGYGRSIEAELNMLGANVFQVQKWDFGGGEHAREHKYRKDLKKEYSEIIRGSCDLVKFAGAEVWLYNVVYSYKNNKTDPTFLLAGGEPEFFYNNAEPVESGRILSRSDVNSNARVVVIGQDIVSELFPYEDPVGKTIKISGTKFKVVGVTEDLGSSTFGESKNNRAVIPITTFEDLFGSYRSVYITIMAIDAYHIEEAKDQVIGVMRKIRKVKPGEENDFHLWSNQSLVEGFRNIADKIEIGAIVIGLISLLVGSIGVMNIMLVTVTERTREIGVRKAVGARRATILTQFLNESVVLSLIGGAIGLLAGFSFAGLMSVLFDIPFAVPLWAVITALLVTSIVGLFAGLYPAAKAAKLDPIVALRYE